MRLIKKLVHVVAAVIKNENGEILCALRGPEMELPNYWEFPGGKIEKGESKVEALEREILEELGCQIEVFEGVDDTTYEYQKVIVRLETFKAKIVKGIPRASEHAELKWVPTIRLPELHWAPADIPTVRRLVNNA